MISGLILTVIGLAFFEAISSIDNAIINAQVLSSMSKRARKWFVSWGLFPSVLLIRGILPLLVVWIVNPYLGIIGVLTATFSGNPEVAASIERSAPIILIGGGVFLVFLFLHFLFWRGKTLVFYIITAIILVLLAWLAGKISVAMVFALGVGTLVFFITQGFKLAAEKEEKKLLEEEKSDLKKLIYLEIIDATFSVDGVLGAFAFTLSVPLILLGSAIGALVVRQLTVGNIERIKKLIFLEKGAMYSVLFLGTIMILNSFGFNIPEWASPVVTFLVVGYFFLKSRKAL